MNQKLLGKFTGLAAAILLVSTGVADAQPGPGNPGGGFPQPGGQPQQTPKNDGIAEEAPEDRDALPTMTGTPPPMPKHKRFELLELDGYLRFRTDWMKNLHLGFNDQLDGGAPYPRSASCRATGGECSDTLKSANMQLRLEPTINIDERMAIKMQIDVLDNVVLGSTPINRGATDETTPYGSIRAFSRSNEPPLAGVSSPTDAIRVKRAWGEVRTSFDAVLQFGRQPGHWGMGLWENEGGRNPIRGTIDYDNDFGTTVDRIRLDMPIPGTSLRAAISTDWVSTTPVSDQTDFWNQRYGGQSFDLEDSDDVSQWTLVISKLDTPRDFRDLVNYGKFALNYGVYFGYRTQGWDNQPAQVQGDPIDEERIVRRDLKAYIFDPWIRFAFGDLDVEAEAVGIFGDIDGVEGLSRTEPLDLRQFAGVVRGSYGFIGGDLRLGLEVGFATGDQWDNNEEGNTHFSNATLPRDGDGTVNAFFINPAFNIDLILFRELLGTVTNATYIRPNLSYSFADAFAFKAQSVISFANKPVSTPGNSSMYGIEFDFDLSYRNGGFRAGLAYGILFPMGALDHPDDTGLGGPGFGFDAFNIGEASNAHTIQTRLVLDFY